MTRWLQSAANALGGGMFLTLFIVCLLYTSDAADE